MRRVLRPGGRLALSVWRPVEHNVGHAVFADALERHVSEQAAATRRAPFNLSEKEEIRGLVISAGFDHVMICLDVR